MNILGGKVNRKLRNIPKKYRLEYDIAHQLVKESSKKDYCDLPTQKLSMYQRVMALIKPETPVRKV